MSEAPRTQEIWGLEKGPGAIKKYRFRILFGARQEGEPREPDLARLGCSREAVGGRGGTRQVPCF